MCFEIEQILCLPIDYLFDMHKTRSARLALRFIFNCRIHVEFVPKLYVTKHNSKNKDATRHDDNDRGGTHNASSPTRQVDRVSYQETRKTYVSENAARFGWSVRSWNSSIASTEFLTGVRVEIACRNPLLVSTKETAKRGMFALSAHRFYHVPRYMTATSKNNNPNSLRQFSLLSS